MDPNVSFEKYALVTRTSILAETKKASLSQDMARDFAFEKVLDQNIPFSTKGSSKYQF